MSIAKASAYTALNLLVFALIGTALLAITYDLTHEPIVRSEEKEKLKLITQIAPAETYDNDIIKDSAALPADALLGSDSETIVYRGRRKDQPSIAVLQVIAPDGYSGKISLIISIYSDGPNAGKVGGVRVISHKETPGLGDYIEVARNKWITGFNGTSLEQPKDSDWKVKKDGGSFDYMAGATITPRAVVKAVRKALQYFAANRDKLFSRNPLTPDETTSHSTKPSKNDSQVAGYPGLPLSGEEQSKPENVDGDKNESLNTTR